MQRSIAIALSLVGTASILGLIPTATRADTPAGSTSVVCSSDGSCVVTVQSGGGSGGSSPGSSGGGGSSETCTWDPITAQQAQAQLQSIVPPTLVHDGPPGPSDSWYDAWCVGGSIGPQSVVYLVEAAPGTVDIVTPAQVAQIAVSDLLLRPPTVSMAPPGGKAIVNLKSWLWISPADWQPITATATAGGITATATATPQYVVWAMGDGNKVTCDGPGAAYNTSIPDQDQSTTCGYTYQETSGNAPNQQFTITATIEYDVTWTSAGVAGGGDLGDIAGQSTMIPITVDEIGTVIVPNP